MKLLQIERETTRILWVKYISNNPNNIEILFDLFDVSLGGPSRASSSAPTHKPLIGIRPLPEIEPTVKEHLTATEKKSLNAQLAILRRSGEVGLVPQSLPDHPNFA